MPEVQECERHGQEGSSYQDVPHDAYPVSYDDVTAT
jgi:hypothetical protein